MKKSNELFGATVVILAGVGLTLWFKKEHAPLLPVASSQASSLVPAAQRNTEPAPPAVSSSQPVAPSGPSNQKKFSEMGVLERNAIRREIAQQQLPAIFQAMLDAESVEHDSLKQMGLRTTFAIALKERTPTPEFLQQVRMFIADASNSSFERQLVIGALELAATKETLSLLLEVVRDSPDQKIKESAGSLAGIGSLGHGGSELSPALENVWRSSSDPNLLLSTAAAMARIGAPDSIELLLATVRTGNEGDKVRLDAARSALREVCLPTAVPPLAAALAGQSPSTDTARLVAQILVKIGDTTAGHVVIGWLQYQNEDATPLVRDLIVQHTTNGEMLMAWADAIKPSVSFRNEGNREAIRAGLAEYYSSRVLSRERGK